ncbi:MAG: IS630 transposase-related protein [Pseudomonadota bacterium]
MSRWKKEITPKLTRNKRPIKINDEALKKDIKEYPDAYSYERARRLEVKCIWDKACQKTHCSYI